MTGLGFTYIPEYAVTVPGSPARWSSRRCIVR
jgi:hypothetical protein